MEFLLQRYFEQSVKCTDDIDFQSEKSANNHIEPVEVSQKDLPIKEMVDRLIKDNKVMIFSKSYCPFCKKAKALFDKLNIKYHALEMDTLKNGAEIQIYLVAKTGLTTVPNIFVSGKHIGGSDDLALWEKTGELQKLL